MDQRIFLKILFIIFAFPQVQSERPLIIAHRGSSGELPDLTLEAFRLAVEQKADFIEIDICVTRDGKLVVIHDVDLSASTTIANMSQFNSRRRKLNVTTTAKSKPVKVKPIDDWPVIDFTLAEIRQLKKRQREAFRNPNFDGKFGVPSFLDVLRFMKENDDVKLLVELKIPNFFNNFLKNKNVTSLTMEELVLNDINKVFDVSRFNRQKPRIILQTFEEDSVSRLLKMTPIPVILLQSYGYPDENGLRNLKDSGLYGVAPRKSILLGVKKPEDLMTYKINLTIPSRSALVERTHALGLKIFVWTFRNEDRFLLWNYGNDPIREYDTFAKLGVDGIITDFPATANRILASSGENISVSLFSMIAILTITYCGLSFAL